MHYEVVVVDYHRNPKVQVVDSQIAFKLNSAVSTMIPHQIQPISISAN